jgi:hypothetical protein
MSKGWDKVASELKVPIDTEEKEPVVFEKIEGGPTGIMCSACDEEYTFQRDFHPRGGKQLVPAHRCLAKGGGLMGMKRFIRTLS